MSDDLRVALSTLDPENDEHWTNDGQARLDVLKNLAGDDVTRQAVKEFAPEFSRENPTLDEASDSGPGESEDEAPEDDEDLQAKHEAAKKELEAASLELSVAQKRHAEAVAAANQLFAQMNREITSADRAANIRVYLESQKKHSSSNADMVQKIAAVLKSQK